MAIFKFICISRLQLTGPGAVDNVSVLKADQTHFPTSQIQKSGQISIVVNDSIYLHKYCDATTSAVPLGQTYCVGHPQTWYLSAGWYVQAIIQLQMDYNVVSKIT